MRVTIKQDESTLTVGDVLDCQAYRTVDGGVFLRTHLGKSIALDSSYVRGAVVVDHGMATKVKGIYEVEIVLTPVQPAVRQFA